MKIAIDVSQMCYAGTGVARYVRGLTQALLNASSPHQYLLFAGALRQRSFFTQLQQSPPWNKAKWKILPLPPKLAGLVFNSLPLNIETLLGKVDLFHSSDWSEPSSHCPRVTTVHDLVFAKHPETVDPLIRTTQSHRLTKIVAGTTQIIADSLSTKNDLMEIYGLPSSRIDVVYPGIEYIYCPQSKQEIQRVKTKYKLPDQFILSVGKQEPRKNLTRLEEAAKGTDLPLVLVGKHGWGTSITSEVITLGYVDELDLPALYSAATVFAYPSLYEGFGFPPLEAMACGTPVVTSNLSSLPEIVGESAILVDPLSSPSIRDGLTQALSSRDKLITLGLSQAQKFTWDQTAQQVMEVYEKIAHRD